MSPRAERSRGSGFRLQLHQSDSPDHDGVCRATAPPRQRHGGAHEHGRPGAVVCASDRKVLQVPELPRITPSRAMSCTCRLRLGSSAPVPSGHTSTEGLSAATPLSPRSQIHRAVSLVAMRPSARWERSAARIRSDGVAPRYHANHPVRIRRKSPGRLRVLCLEGRLEVVDGERDRLGRIDGDACIPSVTCNVCQHTASDDGAFGQVLEPMTRTVDTAEEAELVPIWRSPSTWVPDCVFQPDTTSSRAKASSGPVIWCSSCVRWNSGGSIAPTGRSRENARPVRTSPTARRTSAGDNRFTNPARAVPRHASSSPEAPSCRPRSS